MSAILSNTSAASTTYYTPIYDDDKKEILWENVRTNILNILGYIPGVSTISGVARVFFAQKMLDDTPDNDHSRINYYENQISRGNIEIYPVVGNLIMMITDIAMAIYLKYNENEPIVKDTESLYLI